MNSPSHTIGIRELKAQLSRHLKRVRAGALLVITERGRKIATINPLPAAGQAVELEWAQAMVANGEAEWAGGKPKGVSRPVTLAPGPSLSDTVLAERR